jgi:hypothetical protein
MNVGAFEPDISVTISPRRNQDQSLLNPQPTSLPSTTRSSVGYIKRLEQFAVIGNAQYQTTVGKAEDKPKVNEPSHTVSNNTVRLKTT